MTRLDAQWQRLYALPDHAPHTTSGGVRALVLELARPTDWGALLTVWQAAQDELGLPAPAIAVNGVDGHQLWFSLAQPVPVALAEAFLDGLIQRHLAPLPELSRTAEQRVGVGVGLAMPPGLDAPARTPAGHLPRRGLPADLRVPAQQASGHWSAWVAADLARIFSDEPWLDLPPSPDAQADLLSRHHSATRADWELACARLGVAAQAPTNATRPTDVNRGHPEHQRTDLDTAKDTPHHPTLAGPWANPRDFLLAVVNAPTVPLAQRMDAAKALLAHPRPAS